jgi:hypothetical protein
MKRIEKNQIRDTIRRYKKISKLIRSNQMNCDSIQLLEISNYCKTQAANDAQKHAQHVQSNHYDFIRACNHFDMQIPRVHDEEGYIYKLFSVKK